MKDEIREGVEFLRQFLAKYGGLTQSQIDTFAIKLTSLLEQRYVNHWYENNPMKGQAFRCLRLKRSESYMDPVLEKILKETGLSLNQLGLPNDFTLWIDPGEVSVRFGDQVGFTYSIARLNKTDEFLDNVSSNYDNKKLENLVNKNHLGGEESAKSSKPALIVENSAKIFDEKLTAFIRQNSCNNSTNGKNSIGIYILEKKISFSLLYIAKL
jgi:protein Tob/BTG